MQPTIYTLAGRIAAQPLRSLSVARRVRPNPAFDTLNDDDYRARCDAALDEALDAATFAVWEHTEPIEAAAELMRAAAEES